MDTSQRAEAARTLAVIILSAAAALMVYVGLTTPPILPLMAAMAVFELGIISGLR